MGHLDILGHHGPFLGRLVPTARSFITLPTVIFFLLSCIVRELIMRAFFDIMKPEKMFTRICKFVYEHWKRPNFRSDLVGLSF